MGKRKRRHARQKENKMAEGDTYTDPRGFERTELAGDFGGEDGLPMQEGEGQWAFYKHGRVVGFIQVGVTSTGEPGELIGDVGYLATLPRGTVNVATKEPKAGVSGKDRTITSPGWIIGVWTKADGTVGNSGGVEGPEGEVYVDADGNIVQPPAGPTVSGFLKAQKAINQALVDFATGK